MKPNTRIYNKWQGYTLADCKCIYCLYYGGRRRQNIICLADTCICKNEIAKARCRERRRKNGSKD